MKSIQLFHSYNYVNETFIHDNKNIYDKNNKLIYSLLNIPNNSDLYNIQLQRILKKKIFSKKKDNKSFYTKHNIKVFLLLKCNVIRHYLRLNKSIPEFDLLYKIILNNIIINKNEFIHNVICINKSYNKKFSLNNTIINDFNFFNLNDYYLDIRSKKIIEKKKIIIKKYNVNGCIIYYDLLKLLIEEFITYKNTIIIGTQDQNRQFNIINTIYCIDKNNVYDTIIVLDTSIDISKLKYSNIIVCVNKTIKITINEVLLLLDKFFKINLYKYKLTNKLIYNLINICVFRNYSQKLIKINELKLHDNKAINIKHFRIDNSDLIHSTCSICVTNKINIETSCNHHLCSDCVSKILHKNKLTCPYCRTNININNLTYLVKSKNDIVSDKSTINSKYKYLIKKSMKHDISIISNYDSKNNCLKNLYKFMGINPNICSINNISNITNNIYFLDKKEKHDINSISNSLIKNGLIKNGIKKINLNFFS